jgi:hypothetical protein
MRIWYCYGIEPDFIWFFGIAKRITQPAVRRVFTVDSVQSILNGCMCIS